MRTSLTYLISIISIVNLLSSCDSSEKHFLKDSNYRTEVQKQFEERTKIAKTRGEELFSVFQQEDLTLEEREALEFLYAYMPLSDLADYDGDFFLNQVRGAFKAREHFDWGSKIPEDVFRHFVLVYRVNTENLDNARDIFFDELKDRVKGLSMEDAVLEVNHWCHEKITYRATDRRTSSPLQLMKTSWGRCGEQSTFTTMALRSVGIPARQCYTPRWVHTDSNHAWVEAWVDGVWRYIGASEPEPELDVAWFDAPVKRAMMVHTNVFGNYQGVEDKTSEDKLYSIINVLDTYADTRKLFVKVVDPISNLGVEGATVRFEVYNYAEFYPIATVKTDKDGMAYLKTNAEGDVIAWVSKGGEFVYKHIKQEDIENVVILGNEIPMNVEELFVMDVPKEHAVKELSKEKIAKNAIKLAQEDSIRNAYMETFVSEDDARKMAKELQLDEDRVWRLLNLSQGNWKDILEFIKNNSDHKFVLDYLDTLVDKELRDTPTEYLNSHFVNADKLYYRRGTPESMLVEYIYSPHIAYELIRPWRAYFQEKFDEEEILSFQHTPSLIVEYVRSNITTTDTENYYNCPISPRGVYEMKLADKHSRDIFFVALCRSFGVAARLEPSTSRPQYYDGDWKDVLFEIVQVDLPKGKVIFTDDKDNIVKPAYSSHYTIARFEENRYSTLNFRGNEALKKLDGSVSVDSGNYRLTIGSRANNGSVTVLNRFFQVLENQSVTQQIQMPQPEGLIQVQGIVDPNTIVELDNGKQATIKALMNGKGLVLVFADPDKEPTKHILQDLPAVCEELNGWGGGVIFMVPDDKKSLAFDSSSFKGLPANTVWATDRGRSILNAATSALQIDFTNNFPLVLYINTNGGVIFSHQGYTIGVGENLVKTIKLEQQTF